MTYFYNFGTPLYISRKDRVRNFKFGVPIDLQAYKPKNAKVGQKGRELRRVTYFYNFGTTFISVEQTELESSNLVCGLTSRPTNQEMQK